MKHGSRSNHRGAAAQVMAWRPDLASDIGSWRWQRDMLVFLALLCAAGLLWPTAVQPVQRQMGTAAAGSVVPSAPATATSQPGVVPAVQATRLMLLPGENIADALRRIGVAGYDADEADRLIGKALFPRSADPGGELAVRVGPRRQLYRLDLRARLDIALTVVRQAGRLTIAAKPVAVDATPVRLRGKAGPNLARSLAVAGVPPTVARSYLAALGNSAEPKSSADGPDAFDLVFANRRAIDGRAEAGPLLYAASLKGDTLLREFAAAGEGGGALVRVNRAEAGDSLLPARLPVAGRFTSSFGPRYHPVLGVMREHAGIDIGASWGTPVKAIADGVVTFAGWHGGHGKFVRIAHAGGLSTGYGHLADINVAAGSRVRGDDVIGTVGSTGLSTGPHLHYEVYRSGRPVNPLEQSPWQAAGLSAGHRMSDTGMTALKSLRYSWSVPATAD